MAVDAPLGGMMDDGRRSEKRTIETHSCSPTDLVVYMHNDRGVRHETFQDVQRSEHWVDKMEFEVLPLLARKMMLARLATE